LQVEAHQIGCPTTFEDFRRVRFKIAVVGDRELMELKGIALILIAQGGSAKLLVWQGWGCISAVVGCCYQDAL